MKDRQKKVFSDANFTKTLNQIYVFMVKSDNKGKNVGSVVKREGVGKG